MWLPRTELALEECRKHLTETGSFNTPIEAYITRGLIVLLCAEIEASVTDLIVRRVEASDDAEVRQFAKSISKGFVRNAKPAEVGDVVGRFGEHCKQRYQQSLDASIGDGGRMRIGDLVANRDRFAHGEPPDVTFRELQEAFNDALGLLEAVEKALGLPHTP
jgi:hypothetical protein